MMRGKRISRPTLEEKEHRKMTHLPTSDWNKNADSELNIIEESPSYILDNQ